MSRLYYPPEKSAVLTKSTGGEGGADIGDAAKKIAKLIPAELVTAYAASVSAVLSIKFEAARLPAYAICFLVCLVLTPIILNNQAEPGKPKRNHLIISTLAFPIWAYLVSGNQVIPEWYDAGIATIVTILFSLASTAVPMDK